MKQIIFMVSLVSLMLVSELAVAQYRGDGNNYRRQNQRERIQHGRYNGQLTQREAMQLKIQQARIRQYKRMAKADGWISPRERRAIRGMEMQLNRNIYRQKHDGQNRYGYRDGYHRRNG